VLRVREAIKQGGILLIGSVAGRGSSFLFRYIGAATLQVEAYAALCLYISMFLTLSTIGSLSIGTTLAKLAGEPRRDLAALYRNAVILIFGSSLLSASFFAYWLSKVHGLNYSVEIIVSGFLATIFFASYQVGIGQSLAKMKFFQTSAYDAAEGLTKIIALGALVLFGSCLRLETFVFAFSVSYLILALWAVINNRVYLISSLTMRSLVNLEVGVVKEISGHAVAITLVSFENLLFFFMLRYFLALSSAYEVAVFDFSLVLYSIPKMVFAAVVRPVVPFVARAEYRQVRLPRIKPVLTTFLVGLALSYLALKTGWTRFAFQSLGIGKYEESFPLFLVILMGSFFDLTFGYISSYLQGLGRVWGIFTITLIVTVIALPLSFMAVSRYHLYGAAVSCVIFFFLLSMASLLYCRKAIGLTLA
jgi:O-antigen/teichoic acid export membrane protein